MRAYKLANKEKLAKHTKKWRDANKDKTNKYTQEWRANNAELSKKMIRKSTSKFKNNNPEYMRRVMAKRRRNFGYNPLNEKFPGSVGHHINRNDVIYIPEEIHKSIPHSIMNDENVNQINMVAFLYL